MNFTPSGKMSTFSENRDRESAFERSRHRLQENVMRSCVSRVAFRVAISWRGFRSSASTKPIAVKAALVRLGSALSEVVVTEEAEVTLQNCQERALGARRREGRSEGRSWSDDGQNYRREAGMAVRTCSLSVDPRLPESALHSQVRWGMVQALCFGKF